MTTEIKQKQIICDATNNPPSTYKKQLNVRVMIQFEDQHNGIHYHLDLPINLQELRAGTLTSVPLTYITV